MKSMHDSFDNEFNQIAVNIRNRKGSLIGISQKSNVEVGNWSTLLSDLETLKHQMTTKLAKPQLFEKYLLYGDKMYEMGEYEVAKAIFYSSLTDEPFSFTINEEFLSKYYIQGKYGRALCTMRQILAKDMFVKFPATLQQIFLQLQEIQKVMSFALEQEKKSSQNFYWLVMNGCTLLSSICSTLQTLGYASDVVDYFSWTILCAESVVNLCTTKYLPWRMTLYRNIYQCYEQMSMSYPNLRQRYIEAAENCLQRGLQRVQQLRREEELDLPLPQPIEETLHSAEMNLTILKVKMKLLYSTLEQNVSSVLQQTLATDKLRLQVLLELLSVPIEHILIVQQDSQMVQFASQLKVILSPLLNEIIITEDHDTKSQLLDQLEGILSMKCHVQFVKVLYHWGQWESFELLCNTVFIRRQYQECSMVEQTQLNLLYVFHQLHQSTHQQDHELQSPKDQVSDGSLDSIKTNEIDEKIATRLVFDEECLLKTSELLRKCCLGSQSFKVEEISDFLTDAAIELWTSYCIPMLSDMDAMTSNDSVDLPLKTTLIHVMLTVHSVFCSIQMDDSILFGSVALKLGVLLNSFKDYSRSVQVLRSAIHRIDEIRDHLIVQGSHQNMDKEEQIAFYNAALSLEIDYQISPTLLPSFFGATYHNLAALETDLYCTLFKAELELGIKSNTTLKKHKLSHLRQQMENKKDSLSKLGNQKSKKSKLNSNIPSLHTTKNIVDKDKEKKENPTKLETRLLIECRKNGYTKALLLMQMARYHESSGEEQENYLNDAFKLLQEMREKEQKLKENLRKKENDTPTSVPVAPRIVSRSSTTVTLKLEKFTPLDLHIKKRKIYYYVIYGKLAGAGTDVSHNNNEHLGTGVRIFDVSLPITVYGLTPNESYVFATAAYDEQGILIGGIGDPTIPTTTMSPLPVLLCLGYLTIIANELHCNAIISSTANCLYDIFVKKDPDHYPFNIIKPLDEYPILQKLVVTESIPILQSFIQSVLIMVKNQGKLNNFYERIPFSKSVHKIFVPDQLNCLDKVKKILIAIEIACAIDNHTLIMTAVHSCYHTMNPLLQLKKKGQFLFPALLVLHQSLKLVPKEEWDMDTCKIFASICYELTKNAIELEETKVLKCIVVESLPPSYASSLTSSMDSFCSQDRKNYHSIELFNLLSQIDQDNDVWKTKIDGLSLLCKAANENPKEAMVFLQSKLNHHPRFLEFGCKICKLFLENGEKDVVEQWFKMTNDQLPSTLLPSTKETLKSFHMYTWNLENNDSSFVNGTEEKTSKEEKLEEATENENNKNFDEFNSGNAFVFSNEEKNQLQWYAEREHLLGLNLFNEIGHEGIIDLYNGPDQEFEWDDSLLQETFVKNDQNSVVVDVGVNENDRNNVAVGVIDVSVPNMEKLNLFNDFLSHMSNAAKLFSLVHCWKSLENVCKSVWNGIWKHWISPECYQNEENRNWIKKDSTSISNDKSNLSFETTSSSSRSKNSYNWKPIVQMSIALLDMLEKVIEEFPKNSMESSLTTRTNATTSRETNDDDLISTSISSTKIKQLYRSNVDLDFVVKFSKYSIKVLSHVYKWEMLVHLGERFNELTSMKFFDQVFPYMLHAQKQLWYKGVQKGDVIKNHLNLITQQFEILQKLKKQKKTRLVIEHEVTDEERAFLEEKNRKETELNSIKEETRKQLEHLHLMEKLSEELSRSKSVFLESLASSRFILHQFEKSFPQILEEKAKSVIQSYKKTIVLLRSKRDFIFYLAQALHELGSFYFRYCDDIELAKKYWNEAIDIIFGALQVTTLWRSLLVTNINLLVSLNIWSTLLSIIILGKLSRYGTSNNLHAKLEHCVLGAMLVKNLFTCSLPHPPKNCDFLIYHPSEIWPKLNIFSDRKRCHPLSLYESCRYFVQILIQNDYNLETLPVLSLMDYISTYSFQNASVIVETRIFRCYALMNLGFFSETLRILYGILAAKELPLQNNLVALSLLKLVPMPTLYNHLPLTHPDNHEALHFLNTVNNHQLSPTLRKIYGNQVSDMFSLMTLTFLCKLTAKVKVILPGLAVNDTLLNLQNASSILANRLETSYTTDSSTATNTSATNNTSSTKKSSSTKHSSPTKNTSTTIDGSIANDSNTTNDSRTKLDLLCENFLLQSYVSYSQESWVTSKEYIEKAMQQFICKQQENNNLIDSFFDVGSTFWLKCRLQMSECYRNLSLHKEALGQCELGIEEALQVNEYTVRLKLIVSKIDLLLYMGNLNMAEKTCREVIQECLLTYNNKTESYVHVLRLLSQIQKERNVIQASATFHRESTLHLEEAERILHSHLENYNWMEHKTSGQRNLYISWIPLNVLVKYELAALLVVVLPLKNDETFETRRCRTLHILKESFETIQQSPCALPTIKPQILLLLGALMSQSNQDELQLKKSISYLEQAIQNSREEGGEDRRLIHAACMELVESYHRYYPKDHGNPAYYYMQLASQVSSNQYTLWKFNQEFQSQPLDHIDSLPSYITDNIENTTTSILHYYHAILGQKEIYQSNQEVITRRMLQLHYYFQKYYSFYADQCCSITNDSLSLKLKENPTNINGYINIQWKKNYAPATSGFPLKQLTMFYLLGTSSNISSNSDKTSLKQKTGLDGLILNHLQRQVGSIRRKMENRISQESQTQFKLQFFQCFNEICHFFSPNKSLEEGFSDRMDFNIEVVRIIEHMLDSDIGVNGVINISICDILQDIL